MKVNLDSLVNKVVAKTIENNDVVRMNEIKPEIYELGRRSFDKDERHVNFRARFITDSEGEINTYKAYKYLYGEVDLEIDSIVDIYKKIRRDVHEKANMKYSAFLKRHETDKAYIESEASNYYRLVFRDAYAEYCDSEVEYIEELDAIRNKIKESAFDLSDEERDSMEEEFKGLFVKAMIYKEVSGMARSEKYDASEFGINFRTPEEVTEQKAYDEKCRIEDEMEASYVPCRGNFFERNGMSHLSDDFEQ